MDNLSTEANRGSQDLSDLSRASSSSQTDTTSHHHSLSLTGEGFHPESDTRDSVPAWSPVNLREQTAPRPPSPDLAQSRNAGFAHHMTLTPEGGPVRALPFVHDDGVW